MHGIGSLCKYFRFQKHLIKIMGKWGKCMTDAAYHSYIVLLELRQ